MGRFFTYYLILLILLTACKKEGITLNVLTYGHAGATLNSGNWIYPPNSEAAIRYGMLHLNADGVEVDAQMTKDSVLVLFHDNYLSPAIDKAGCIGDYNWNELKGERIYNTKHEIITLKYALSIIQLYKKKCIIDLKHQNACSASVPALHTFNYALANSIMEGIENTEDQIILNSRNLSLITQINSLGTLKSFETDDLDLGFNVINAGVIQELTLRYSNLEQKDKQNLKEKNISFSLFGAVTRSELKNAVSYLPNRIITDNIAYTKKITY